MRRVSAKGPWPRANVGSLLDDVDAMAKSIYAALIDDDVLVWASPGLDVYFMHAKEAPEVPVSYVLGTYRMGASTTDIAEDLHELRKSRVSAAMIF
ncbi:MAG: hypothetical protein ABIQ70_05195 [Dokdonella sp.]